MTLDRQPWRAQGYGVRRIKPVKPTRVCSSSSSSSSGGGGGGGGGSSGCLRRYGVYSIKTEAFLLRMLDFGRGCKTLLNMSSLQAEAQKIYRTLGHVCA